MLEKVKSFLKQYNLQDKTIIVGFSGGYDSMCLLDILSKIKNDADFYSLKIIAAHFNHNWRGEESLREQEICKLFATSKGIEFYTKTASNTIKKSENEARIARYDFFEEALENYDADAIFTAHNKDDNAETVLYRIIKGTGIIGLKGIAQKRDYFYRPLLTTTRSEIMEYCDTNNLSPNNDSSNSDITYKRNYLRLNIIPALEKINPLLKESLNTLAEIAKNDNAIIEEYLESLRKNVFNNDTIISANYKQLSKPIKLRFLYEFIQNIGLDYDYKRINDLYSFIEEYISKRNGSTMSIATTQWLYVDEKIIEVIPRKQNNPLQTSNFEIIINAEGEYQVGTQKFVIKPYVENEIFKFPESTANFAYVDFSNINIPLTLRYRRDGDIITPFGMTGKMKLKKYLNAKGINRHKRDEILVLAEENEILWAVGIGISNKICVTKTPTHVIEVIQ
ncbi:tRNA lysidine(34) synthetase TilS [bacterium]|nr:tRNA lysidine(34) synthetase TilS [bacterium]